jgi:hypothetical protein
MIEVVELLVNGVGKNCKKNQWGFLSQRSLATLGGKDKFKIQDSRLKI